MSEANENQNDQTTETGTSSAESQTTSTETTSQSSQATTQEGQSSSTLAEALKDENNESGQSGDNASTEEGKGDQSSETDTSGDGNSSSASKSTQDSGYEIEVAPDSPISDEDLDQIVKMAEENNWTKEQADAAIKQYEDYYNRGAQKATEPWKQYYTEQQQRFDKDPDFNGDNKAKTFTRIRAAVTKFAGEDMIKQLSRPEIGNNYELAKFLAKIGAQLEGDSPELFGKGAPGNESTDDPETARMKSMYPGFFK